jgi:hypothetical protein
MAPGKPTTNAADWRRENQARKRLSPSTTSSMSRIDRYAGMALRDSAEKFERDDVT